MIDAGAEVELVVLRLVPIDPEGQDPFRSRQGRTCLIGREAVIGVERRIDDRQRLTATSRNVVGSVVPFSVRVEVKQLSVERNLVRIDRRQVGQRLTDEGRRWYKDGPGRRNNVLNSFVVYEEE